MGINGSIGLEAAINRRMNDIADTIDLHESWLQLLKDGRVEEVVHAIETELEVEHARIDDLRCVLERKNHGA